MKIKEVVKRLDTAIKKLIDREVDLIKRELAEPNLTGHLAKYLTPLFDTFDVDPEYNGDKLKPNDRKALAIAKSRMRNIGIEPNESDTYPLRPDIIIHKRNTNEFNLVVIEVKKDSNSKKSKEFDLLKLEHLTIDYLGNHYNYKLGVALTIGTKNDTGSYSIKYFQNGILTTEENLK